MPPPRSETEMPTLMPSAFTRTSMGPPPGMASRALRRRYKSAWRICPSSNRAGGERGDRGQGDGTAGPLDLGAREVDDVAHRGRDVLGLHARRREARQAQVLLREEPEALRPPGRSRRAASATRPAAPPSPAPPRGARCSGRWTESGFRISCVTWAAIFPMAARRSLATARLCARETDVTICSKAAASSPISSSVGARAAASGLPARRTGRARSRARAG